MLLENEKNINIRSTSTYLFLDQIKKRDKMLLTDIADKFIR